MGKRLGVEIDTIRPYATEKELIMGSLSGFCTCGNLDCPLHPTKHDKGCAPCISKNLNLRELPNCFFNTVDGAEKRIGDSYVDFAKLVLHSGDG